MKKRKTNINFLKVNNDDRSSLFVLDLKEAEKIKRQVEFKKKKFNFEEFSGQADEKISNIFLGFKNKLSNLFSFGLKIKKEKIFKKIKIPKIEAIKIKLEEEGQSKAKKGFKKIDDLAFLSLFKIFVLFLYKLSYLIGYYIIYGFRFIALFIYSFFSKFTDQSHAKQNKPISVRKKNFKKNINFIFNFFKANLRFKKKIKQKKVEVIKIKKKNKKFEFLKSDIPEPILETPIKKYVLKFALVLFIIILPFKILSLKSMSLADLKGRVLGASEAAVGNLVSAGGSMAAMDFDGANNSFSKASEDFLRAQSEINDINDIFLNILKILPSQEAKLASESKSILAGGQIASELGSDLSLAIEAIFKNKDKNLIEIIDQFIYYGQKSLVDINRLNQILATIDIDNLPEEYRGQFIDIKKKSVIAENGLREFVSLAPELKEFLGEAYDKRYLLVFQNNTEMRASGGFIGSYALVDFSNGRIKNIEAPGGGSYDTEGGLKVLVQSPKPLQLVSGLWYFWDVNWWPDWAKSAKKLMWFYEKSGGPTVDGVISLTPTVLEDMLKIIGPIDMSEKYGVVLDSENFWNTVQTAVEGKDNDQQTSVDDEIIDNAPKQIIGDLINKIIEEFPKRLDKEKFVKILSSIEKNLSEKQILFYFNDEKMQSEIERLGWSGRLRDFKWDYLSVINTNIAGGKSDKMIRESISLESDVSDNGDIINTLKIKREHTGVKNEPFTGVRNVDWIRIYVPLGSELIETSGFSRPHDIYFDEIDPNWQKDADVLAEEESTTEQGLDRTNIYTDSGKTVFANWSMIDPGETADIIIRYKLPFKLEKKEIDNTWPAKLNKFLNPDKKKLIPYAIYFQKQPGSLGSKLSYQLNIPNNIKIAMSYPPEGTSEDIFKLNTVLNIDKYEAFFLEQNK